MRPTGRKLLRTSSTPPLRVRTRPQSKSIRTPNEPKRVGNYDSDRAEVVHLAVVDESVVPEPLRVAYASRRDLHQAVVVHHPQADFIRLALGSGKHRVPHVPGRALVAELHLRDVRPQFLELLLQRDNLRLLKQDAHVFGARGQGGRVVRGVVGRDEVFVPRLGKDVAQQAPVHHPVEDFFLPGLVLGFLAGLPAVPHLLGRATVAVLQGTHVRARLPDRRRHPPAPLGGVHRHAFR